MKNKTFTQVFLLFPYKLLCSFLLSFTKIFLFSSKREERGVFAKDSFVGESSQKRNRFERFWGDDVMKLQQIASFSKVIAPKGRVAIFAVLQNFTGAIFARASGLLVLLKRIFLQNTEQGPAAHSSGWRLKGFSLFSAFILLIGANGWGQTIATLSGSGTWYVPAGVTSITVKCWGGGGGGGGSTSNGNGGSGGGSGAYTTLVISSLTAGTPFTYSVGAAGTAGSGGSATAVGGTGGASTVSCSSPSVSLSAGGGNGGTANKGAFGTGGAASGGSTNTAGASGSAGTTLMGAGGAAPGGGGAGGTGGGTNGNGIAGTAPGGGGSGGEANSTSKNGGAGGAGRITITYTNPYCAISGTTPTDYYISNVSTSGGITNISKASTQATSGYAAYWDSKVGQYQSSSITLNPTINGVAGAVDFGVYVDWNKDGDFTDTGEEMYTTGGQISANPSITILVPATATVGVTNMRLWLNYAVSTPTPCTASGNGEVEDYLFEVLSATPTLTLANPTTAISATNICASSTAVPIHAFNITGSNGGGTLTNFAFTTTGTYLSADVTNFKLLYNTTNTTVLATTIATSTTPGGPGAKTFTAFTQAIGNATGYFWITMDVAAGATDGRTITVSASAASGADMTTTVAKAGTAAASGAKTLKATPSSTAGVAQTVCSTATMAATNPTVGTGAWTLTSGSGTITTSSAYNSGLTALGVGANQFTWTVSNSTCTAATSTVTITGTATPIPTFTAQAGATACGNTDVTYTTQTGMTNYTWTYSGTLNTDYSITSGGGTSSNTVTLKWLTSGNKTVTINYTNAGGCAAGSPTSSTTTAVTLQPTLTSLSYAGSPFCTSVASGTATLVGTNTPTGGTYSSTTGLTINSSTGAVTPTSSTAGSYTVTYTKAAGVCNAASTTASVTITTLPTASISYAGTPFCTSVTSASPSLTGTAGGTYSSTAGLSITGSTGVINPSLSSAGTYTVTYTISAASGCSAVTATTSVSVLTTPSITTPPSNTSVATGGNTSLTTVASNTPTSYTWEVYNGTSWSTIATGGVYSTVNAAALTITGATLAMNGYLYRVTATNSCSSSSVSSSAILTVSYCSISGTTNTSYYISNVATSSGVTNISNTSTYTSNAYTSFTSSSVSQYAGSSITLNPTINGVAGAVDFGVYVDWNADGDFTDSGEELYTTGSQISANPSITILVPATATVGSTRMRLWVNYNTSTPAPCTAPAAGEVEDYTFTVLTLDCSNITTFYSKSTGNLNLVASWGSNTDGTGCSPADFTTAGITYIIQNNLSPATSAAWTVTGAGSIVKFGNSTAAVTFTAGANLIYNCDLEITGNATLNMGSYNLTLSGDFIRSASTSGFIQTAGSASTVTFSGSSQEVNVTAANGTIATDSDITFNHVTISGSNVKLFYYKTNDRKLNINNFTVNVGAVVTLYSNPL